MSTARLQGPPSDRTESLGGASLHLVFVQRLANTFCLMATPPMFWFYDQGHLSSVEGEVAKWFAVDFCKTQLVKGETSQKDIDACPSISGAGTHTQLLISQCRR